MPAGLPKPPLTQRDYERINRELAALAQAKQQIEMANQAGIACAEADEECKKRIDFLTNLKKVYFSDQP